jgi:hypothetical protein
MTLRNGLLGVGLLLGLGACARSEPFSPRDRIDPPTEVVDPPLPPPDPIDPSTLITAGPCDSQGGCHDGFHCNSATVCELNGSDGPLQFTLQWRHVPRTPDDLDLHVVEPNGCELYFANKNDGFLGSTCDATGSLDLDANAFCSDTNPGDDPGADTENVIYPTDRRPPSGHYIVRVDHWETCVDDDLVEFVVTVRNHSVVTRFNGTFHSFDADEGGAGSDRTITTFDLP